MTNSITFGSKPNLNVEGRHKVRRLSIDITSYTASGEAITAANCGLKKITDMRFLGASDNGFVARWDSTNSKIRAYSQDASGTTGSATAALREADASDDIGVLEIEVIGK